MEMSKFLLRFGNGNGNCHRKMAWYVFHNHQKALRALQHVSEIQCQPNREVE